MEADLLDRVRKLLAKAEDEGCSPAEAEALTAKAAELMARYGIDRALLGALHPETDRPADRVFTLGNPWGDVKRHLLAGLAMALRCQCVQTRSADGTRLHVFGYMSDLERADILFTSLLVQMARALAKQAVPGSGGAARAWRRSWMLGYCTAVVTRVRAAEEAAVAASGGTAEPGAAGSGQSAALVIADRSLVVRRQVAAAYPRLRKTRVTYSGGGYGDGYREGQKADIGGPKLRSRAAGALGRLRAASGAAVDESAEYRLKPRAFAVNAAAFAFSPNVSSSALFWSRRARRAGAEGAAVANFGERYQLIGRLGSGGMGEVWLAHDEQLAGRPVAIKIMHQHMLPNPDDVARFEREMRLAAMMDHPNIVTVYTTGTHDGAPFMVMEYLRGQDLEQAVPGGDPERVAGIGRDICSALAYAHRQGVIHRDIKPGNLFLCESGQVKVTDFGVAKAVGGVTASTADSLPGTVAYLPPERWRGEPPTFSNDIWAAGCVLYQLISGRLPLVFPDTAGYAAAAIRGDPIPDLRDISEAPAWVTSPVMAMLALDPSSRPTAGDCVRLLSDEQPPASVAGPRCPPGLPGPDEAGPGEPGLSLVTGRATEEPVAAPVTQPTAARAAASRPRRPDRMVFVIGGAALLLLAGSITAWLLTTPAHVSKIAVRSSATSAPSSRAAAAKTLAASASVVRSESAAATLPSSAVPADSPLPSAPGSRSSSPVSSRSSPAVSRSFPASSRPEPPTGTSAVSSPASTPAASAPAMVPVPNVIGMHFARARKLLESAGFTVALQPNHLGQVVTGMSPSGQAPAGSVITLTYST